MGKLNIKLMANALVAMLLVAIASAKTGQSSLVCKVKVSELVECLPAITGDSPPKPTAGCCKVLKKADLQCLCKRKSDLRKVGANPAKALELPEECGLHVPQECKTKL